MSKIIYIRIYLISKTSFSTTTKKGGFSDCLRYDYWFTWCLCVFGTWNLLDLFYIFGVFLTKKTNWFVYTNAEITIVKSQFTFVFSFLKSTPTWKKYATDGSDYILIISNEFMRSILIISYFQGPALRA